MDRQKDIDKDILVYREAQLIKGGAYASLNPIYLPTYIYINRHFLSIMSTEHTLANISEAHILIENKNSDLCRSRRVIP